MKNDIQVVVSSDIYLMQIKKLQEEITRKDKEIEILKIKLEYERSLREEESKVKHLEVKIEPSEPVKKTRKKREVTPETNSYSDFKSDGKRKPHAADSIRSYDDFKAIQDYYLSKGKVRDWALWTIGTCLGLRISDLLSLKFENVIDVDKKTIKPRIQIYEQKTGKYNECLITEAVRDALERYLNAIKHEFDLGGYLFPSYKTKGKMYEEYGWKILSDAGKALGLPLNIGSHTMRKTFANIVACVDKSCVDMNSITKVQGLLNHSDQRVTLKYLGTYQDMYDRARMAVSDFVLGKTDINEIIAGNGYSNEDIIERLEIIEKMITEGQEGM